MYHLQENPESTFEPAVGFHDEWSGGEPSGALEAAAQKRRLDGERFAHR